MRELVLGAIGKVTIERRDSLVVAHLEGEVDISNEQELAQALKESVEGEDDGLVLDLGPASYIDSSGIRTLYAMHRHLSQRRQEFRLVVPGDSRLTKVIELSGVRKTIPIHESLETALA